MKQLRSPKYWILLPVILLAYAVFKGAGQEPTMLVLRLVLLAGVYVAALTDLLEKRVSNRLVAALALAWLLVLSPLVLYDPARAAAIAFNGLMGFVCAGIVLLVVYIVSRKGLGGGDVKLMSAAGLYLGFDGALSALLYGSLLSAVAALGLILAKRMTARDAIPLVPFLYAGILIVEFIR